MTIMNKEDKAKLSKAVIKIASISNKEYTKLLAKCTCIDEEAMLTAIRESYFFGIKTEIKRRG